eukprot:3709154-Amphidinium_carterae.1
MALHILMMITCIRRVLIHATSLHSGIDSSTRSVETAARDLKYKYYSIAQLELGACALPALRLSIWRFLEA